MAETLPTFQQEHPVLNVQNVNSRAESYEAFAKSLEKFSQVTEASGQNIEVEQSNAMYVNSVSNIQELKTQAEKSMMENPAQSSKIAENLSLSLDQIQKDAYVNKADRQKLNLYIQGVNSSVQLKGVANTLKQSQLQAASLHYQSWPNQLTALKDLFLKDHDKAEQLKESMLSSLSNLFSIGAISRKEYANGIKDMTLQAEIAMDHYKEYGNPNSTAQSYHTITSDPLNLSSNTGGDGSHPMNQETAWLTAYHSDDMSFQGVLADINNRNFPDPRAFDNLSHAKRLEAIEMTRGIQMADGITNSGASYPAVVKYLETLKTPGNVLSYRNTALKNGLEQWVNDLKNGNLLSVMNRDPQGKAIINDFIEKNAAIERTYAKDDTNREIAFNINKNNMSNYAVAWCKARHIPGEYIHPISQTDVANTQAAFIAGKDPKNALQIMRSYSKQNQLYLANSLKNTNDRMVLKTLSLSPDNQISESERLSFIAANQKGNVFATIEEGEKNKLYKRIVTNLAPQLNSIRLQSPQEDFTQIQTAMINTSYNYARKLAELNNDSLSGDTKYADEATKIYSLSYPVKSGANYSVNANQIPIKLSDNDWDALATYIIDNGEKSLTSNNLKSYFLSAVSRNPLRMVLSPTNELQAVDNYGNPYYRESFSTDILASAHRYVKEKNQEIVKSPFKTMSGLITKGISLTPGEIIKGTLSKNRK